MRINNNEYYPRQGRERVSATYVMATKTTTPDKRR